MRLSKGVLLMIGLVALTGCSSYKQSHPDGYIKQPTVCIDKKWYGYHQASGCPSTTKAVAPDPLQQMAVRLAALEQERDRLAGELEAARRENGSLSSRVRDLERQLAERERQLSDANAERERFSSNLAAVQNDTDELRAAKRRIAELEAQLAAARSDGGDKDRLAAELAEARQRLADLEGQLADREKELAGLRGDLSAEMEKLKEAERGLIRALRPQISKGNIAVDLNGERLLIKMASSYLFGSGQDQLQSDGVDVLKRVGEILKEYPEYKVAVNGHTDDRQIRGALKEKFPTNQELSEARAGNAAKALEEGGLSGVTTAGFADTKPVAPNSTDAGRAKNRRVEIRVTK